MVDNNHNYPVAYGTPISPVVPIDVSHDSKKHSHDEQPVQQRRQSRVRFTPDTDGSLTSDVLHALYAQGYTKGLAEALTKNKQAFPLRIWVVDNSGSMATRDGHRMLETPKKDTVRFAECTRWAEMQETVDYHAQLAALLKTTTIFRMLNDPGRISGPQEFSIAERGNDFIGEDLAMAQSTMMKTSPGGVTPLTRHILEIRNSIEELAPILQEEGTKVVVVLATDGLPSNEQGIADEYVKEQFVKALRSLEGLPVWVVVRLCTDEEEVVNFWNDLDNNLEFSLEVLDDFCAEAKEVQEFNKWLNYALPLHRMREMGFYHRLFDLLDERKLSKDELRDFFRLLFGDSAVDGLADPQSDWKSFLLSVTRMVEKESLQWNPATKRLEPWINVKKLDREYRPAGWRPWKH